MPWTMTSAWTRRQVGHPTHVPCTRCGAPAHAWCKSRHDNVLRGYSQQHAPRHRRRS